VLKLRAQRGVRRLGGSAAIGGRLGAIPFAPGEIGVIARLAAVGVTSGLVNVSLQTWLQQRIEPAMRGRALSLLMLAVVGLLPFSLALAGILAQISLATLFLASAGLVAVAVIGGLASGRLYAVQ